MGESGRRKGGGVWVDASHITAFDLVYRFTVVFSGERAGGFS